MPPVIACAYPLAVDLTCSACGARVELVLQHATSVAAPHPLVAPIQASDPELISVAEAAKRLGISPGTAYAEMQAGRLPNVRIGRRRLVPVQRLQLYIEEALEGGPNRSVTELPGPRSTVPVAPTYRRQKPAPPSSRRAPRDAPPSPSAPPPEPVHLRCERKGHGVGARSVSAPLRASPSASMS